MPYPLSVFEIFVRPFLDVNAGRWQVSAGGDASPLWGSDIREIFHRLGQTVMRTGVSTTPTIAPATPSVLFGANLIPETGGIQYAPRPDDKRFILTKSHATGDARSQYRVVLNWFDEVLARAPKGK